MENPASKSQSTALITGASAGIGAEFAKVFAANGHNLVLVARREDRLRALADSLVEKHQIAVTVITADLIQSDAAEKLFAETQKLGLNIDILVNNAGLLCEGKFTKSSNAAQQQMLQVNINALTALCHLYGNAMQENADGRILNLCSTSAFQPLPTLACYAASKAYVLSFSEALYAEFNGTGVSVTCLCPGFTNTNMTKQGDRNKRMSLPGLKNMEADAVAQQGYDACMQGKPLYVNGLANQAMALMSGLQPRWIQRLVNGRLANIGF